MPTHVPSCRWAHSLGTDLSLRPATPSQSACNKHIPLCAPEHQKKCKHCTLTPSLTRRLHACCGIAHLQQATRQGHCPWRTPHPYPAGCQCCPGRGGAGGDRGGLPPKASCLSQA
eukprot:1157329-Pelagomonas_calceolata.AAC.5